MDIQTLVSKIAARSTTKSLPLNRDATRSGAKSPRNNGTTGDGNRKNAIRSVRQVRDMLPFSPGELEAIGALEAEYKLAIPPYFFSLINCEDPNDPIRLQSVTSPLEATSNFELDDPLEEDKDSPVPGITHRYPDRCLMVTTHVLHHVLADFARANARPWCATAGTRSAAMTNA